MPNQFTKLQEVTQTRDQPISLLNCQQKARQEKQNMIYILTEYVYINVTLICITTSQYYNIGSWIKCLRSNICLGRTTLHNFFTLLNSFVIGLIIQLRLSGALKYAYNFYPSTHQLRND